MYEESDGSASDYQDSDDETFLLNAAITASYQTSRHEAQQRSGAGPSASTSTSLVTSAAVGVAATSDGDFEIREEFAESDVESEPLAEDNLDDESPPRRKRKERANTKKKNAKFAERLTWAESAERRRRARQERNAAKKEERLLVQKLGRRLTWVRPRHASHGGVFNEHLRRRRPPWRYKSIIQSLWMCGGTLKNKSL